MTPVCLLKPIDRENAPHQNAHFFSIQEKLVDVLRGDFGHPNLMTCWSYTAGHGLCIAAGHEAHTKCLFLQDIDQNVQDFRPFSKCIDVTPQTPSIHPVQTRSKPKTGRFIPLIRKWLNLPTFSGHLISKISSRNQVPNTHIHQHIAPASPAGFTTTTCPEVRDIRQ